MSQDLKLVKNIIDGDTASWERFVEKYSPWILFRARVWCLHECYLTSKKGCCFPAFQKSLKKIEKTSLREIECDEGIEIYIWISSELKKKIKGFAARNGSSLSTFVWSLLNSKNLYIDWLRSKYGRVI